MTIKKFIAALIRARNMFRLPCWQILKLLERYNVPTTEVKLLRKENKLRLGLLGIDVDPRSEGWILKYYGYAVDLVKKNKLTFVRGMDGQINATFGSVTCQIQTAEEVFILKEILSDGIYDFNIGGSFVICDVGMNVGLAALYLADRHRMPVVGFELFPQTFEQLTENLKLNPTLARLIQPSNFGLGGRSGFIEVPYLKKRRGSMGLFANTHSIASCETSLVNVEIKNATQAFLNAVKQFNQAPIVVKMDCEGAEYEILERWAADNILHCVSIIIIEWHRFNKNQDPQILVHLLINSGFAVFKNGTFDANIGIIAAGRAHQLTTDSVAKRLSSHQILAI